MIGPLVPLRNERTTTWRGTLAAPRGSAAGSDLDPQQQAQIAAAHQAFDFEAAERAEICASAKSSMRS